MTTTKKAARAGEPAGPPRAARTLAQEPVSAGFAKPAAKPKKAGAPAKAAKGAVKKALAAAGKAPRPAPSFPANARFATPPGYSPIEGMLARAIALDSSKSTVVRLAVLASLREAERGGGACEVRTLAARLGATKASVSRAVSRMESEGLAATAAVADDKRRERIALTAKGRRLAASVIDGARA